MFTTEALSPRSQTANRESLYVGPARTSGPRGDEPDFPWHELDGRPIVYVSSGGGQSLGFEPAHLLQIARCVDPAAAQLVIAAPGLYDHGAFLAALPPRTVVVPYAPQRALLARARVAVTHGGVGSVNECLELGCPMLVLPLGLEQPLQAELVQRAGAGLGLDPLDMSDAQCRDALHSLLGGACRDGVEAIAASYRMTDSTRAICDALVRVERPAALLA